MTGRTRSPRAPARRTAPRSAVRRPAARRPASRRPAARRTGRAGGPTGLHALAIAVVLAVVAVVLLSLPSQESAAAPRPGRAAAPALVVGADASWPNCRLAAAAHAMTRPAFAIVGVNDGEPGTLSGCLARTMAWAATATGEGDRPVLEYYAMAADPWQPAERRWTRPIWPASAVVAGRRVRIPPAFGSACTGGRTSRACAYVFGWSTARRDALLHGVRDAAAHRWWIDVESERDFNRDSRFNEAIIEGMAAYFTAPVADGGLGGSTGIYSNQYYWSTIVGSLRPGSPLDRLDEWYPIGPGSPAEAARAAGGLAPFTPHGRIVLVQTVQSDMDLDIGVDQPKRGR